ncbi:MAG: 2-hydroxyacyl-CoA dehydratase [Anaerolineae bacterium]|nr:2-hydroxyacyl-CoA dehydratase [Anaerolineae bacterium]
MVDTQALTELTAVARTPLSDWPARFPGRQAMGYLCSYVPVEIIHAAGLIPVRVRSNNVPLRRVDAQLQSFACALCRSALDQLLCGELHFLAGAVLAHTCDAMQALADLWRIDSLRSPARATSAGPAPFVDAVMQPTNLGSPAARPYLIAELGRFRDRLAALVGRPITDDDLHASIALYDDTRQLVGALQRQRPRLSAPDFFAILDAAQIMPREQFNPLLAGLLAALEQSPPPVRRSGPGLFLTGAVLDEPLLLEIIEELGARVTGDDLCTGSRHFQDLVDAQGPGPSRPIPAYSAGTGGPGLPGREGDPIAALAAYFLRRPPCPAKLHPHHDPGPHLLDQVRAARADGVLFVLEKFCDPHAFERALALPALDGAGIPHLLLDAPGAEQSASLEGVRTRLQAFVEMLA